MTSTLTIRTPEGVVFSHLLASPITRSLALSIDLMCVMALGGAVATVVGLAGVISFDLARAFSVLSYFVISIAYTIVTEWYWRGQTLGKRMLRLRVIDQQGLRLHFTQILIRNLLRMVDAFPAFYLVGGVACFLNRRMQRLGDLAAGTVVVRMPRIVEPDLDQVIPDKFNSMRQHPHLEARLRQRVSPREAGLLLQAVLRRDELDPIERVHLFTELAGHLKSLVPFPPEAVEALTDERYVRNAVDILYRTRGDS